MMQRIARVLTAPLVQRFSVAFPGASIAVAEGLSTAMREWLLTGRVELALLRRGGEAVIRVGDTGPGISEVEREAVTKRFYRSDKSRRTEGLGLGLSLVAAIVKLHGFRFTIAAGPGCTVEIACPQVH